MYNIIGSYISSHTHAHTYDFGYINKKCPLTGSFYVFYVCIYLFDIYKNILSNGKK